MTDQIVHESKLTLTIKRCWDCGRFWACEAYSVGGECPSCAQAKRDALVTEIKNLELTVRALRGALTTAKRRKR